MNLTTLSLGLDFELPPQCVAQKSFRCPTEAIQRHQKKFPKILNAKRNVLLPACHSGAIVKPLLPQILNRNIYMFIHLPQLTMKLLVLSECQFPRHESWTESIKDPFIDTETRTDHMKVLVYSWRAPIGEINADFAIFNHYEICRSIYIYDVVTHKEKKGI